MIVHLSSIEDNAGFEIHVHETGESMEHVEPSDEPARWSGELPPLGPYAFVDYAIVVRGTRGNATYKLTVTIR